jgi:hypothetical protein
MSIRLVSEERFGFNQVRRTGWRPQIGEGAQVIFTRRSGCTTYGV